MNKPAAIAVPARRSGPDHFTATEFRRMLDLGAFDGMSIELVGGMLSRMAPANLDHARRQFDLARELDRLVAGTGLIVAVEIALDIDADTVRAVDVALVRAGAASDRPLVGNDLLLAAEVAVSTLHRDLGNKAVDYARAGIEHYWVVDPGAGAVHVMTGPAATGYASRTIVRFGEPLAVPGTDVTITLD